MVMSDKNDWNSKIHVVWLGEVAEHVDFRDYKIKRRLNWYF